MCKLVYDRPQIVHDMFTALKSTPPDLCLDDMKQSLIQVGCLTLQSTPSPKHRSTHPTLTSTSLPSPGHSLTHTRSSTLTRARTSASCWRRCGVFAVFCFFFAKVVAK